MYPTAKWVNSSPEDLGLSDYFCYNQAMRFGLLSVQHVIPDALLQVVSGALLAALALAFLFVWLGEKGVHPFRAFNSRGLVGGCVLTGFREGTVPWDVLFGY